MSLVAEQALVQCALHTLLQCSTTKWLRFMAMRTYRLRCVSRVCRAHILHPQHHEMCKKYEHTRHTRSQSMCCACGRVGRFVAHHGFCSTCRPWYEPELCQRHLDALGICRKVRSSMPSRMQIRCKLTRACHAWNHIAERAKSWWVGKLQLRKNNLKQSLKQQPTEPVWLTLVAEGEVAFYRYIWHNRLVFAHMLSNNKFTTL